MSEEAPQQGAQGRPQKQSRFQRRSSKSPRQRRFRRGPGKKQRRQPPQEKFEGATMGLKCYYYDMGYNRSEQFNKTTKAICNYVGTKYKNGADVRVSVEAMETLVIPIEDIGINPTPLEQRI